MYPTSPSTWASLENSFMLVRSVLSAQLNHFVILFIYFFFFKMCFIRMSALAAACGRKTCASSWPSRQSCCLCYTLSCPFPNEISRALTCREAFNVHHFLSHWILTIFLRWCRLSHEIPRLCPLKCCALLSDKEISLFSVAENRNFQLVSCLLYNPAVTHCCARILVLLLLPLRHSL